MVPVTALPWFVGVSLISHDASRDPHITLHEAASDADVVRVLTTLGRRGVEPSATAA